MADEGGAKLESSGHLNKASLLVTSSAPTTDGEHRKRDLSPSASVGGGRDRSMSVGGAELGSLRSLASKGSVAEDLRAPELLAFEDMTLREHYKVSEKLFENVLHVRSEFKLLSKTLSQMSRHMKSFYDQAVVFSELLQKFTFKTDDDDSGDAIMQVCGSQFVRLAQIQLAMSNQMKDVLMTPMEKFIKEELNSDDLKEKCRQVNSKRDSYNAIHRTKEKLEKKKVKDPSKKVDAKKDAKEAKDAQKVATDLATARREFQASNTTFQKYLSEVHARSRFDFTQRMAAFLYAHKSYYQQGMTVYEYFGEDLLAVMTEMEEARKEFDAHKEEEDHRISIFVSQTQTSGHYKQGYMYKQSHKIKVGKQWSMRWFVMKDGTLSWYSNWKDTSPSGTIYLNLCRVKPIFDKPLCLEILQASPEIRLTLRAMTDKDFAAWTSALNGAIAHALTQDPPVIPESSGSSGSVGNANAASDHNADGPGTLSTSNASTGSPLESLIPTSFAVEMLAAGSTPQELAMALLQVHGVVPGQPNAPGSAPNSPAPTAVSPAAAQFQAFRKKSAKARTARYSASAADLLHTTTATTAITQPSSLALALSPPQLLAKLREQHTSNQFCADCSAPNPDWVCINNGAIICIDCSGIHRSLGSHVSKVRSLGMDSLKPSVQRFLLDIGNAHLNSILEAGISFDPLSASPRVERAADATATTANNTTTAAANETSHTSSTTATPVDETPPESPHSESTPSDGTTVTTKRKKKRRHHATESTGEESTLTSTTTEMPAEEETAATAPTTPHSKSKPPSPTPSPSHSAQLLATDPLEIIPKPTPSSDRATRTKFIVAKYVQLRFVIKSNITVEEANKTMVALVNQTPSEVKRYSSENLVDASSSNSAQQQLSRDLLATFLQGGADLQYQDETTKKSLVHMACEKANVTALSWLVFNGVKGFHHDSQGLYPMHYASVSASIESIQLLYSTPSDVLVKDAQGKTPFELLKAIIVASALQLQGTSTSPTASPSKLLSQQPKTLPDTGKQDGVEENSSEAAQNATAGLGAESSVEGSPSNASPEADTASTGHSPREGAVESTEVAEVAAPIHKTIAVTIVDGSEPGLHKSGDPVNVPLLVAQQTTLEFLAVAQVMQLGKEAAKASAPSSLNSSGSISSPEPTRKESSSGKSRPGPGVGAQAREEARKRSWTLSGRSKDPLGRVPSRETFTREGTSGSTGSTGVGAPSGAANTANATAGNASSETSSGPVIIGGWSGDSTVAVPSAPGSAPLGATEGDMEISRPLGASDAKFMSLRMKNKASQRGLEKFGSISRADFSGGSTPSGGVSALEAAFAQQQQPQQPPSPTLTGSNRALHPHGAAGLLSASTGSLDDISESRGVAIPFSSTLDPLPDSELAGSESLHTSNAIANNRGGAQEDNEGLSSDEELQNALKTGEAALEALMSGDVIGEQQSSPRGGQQQAAPSAATTAAAPAPTTASLAPPSEGESKKKEKRSSGGIFRKKDRKEKEKDKKREETIAEEGEASTPAANPSAEVESESKKDKKEKDKKDKKEKEKDKKDKEKEKEKDKDSTATKRSKWSLLRSFSVRETKKESAPSGSSAAPATESDSVKASTSRSFWKDLERKSSEEQLERQKLQSSGSSPALASSSTPAAGGAAPAASGAQSSTATSSAADASTSSRTRGIQRNNTLAVAGSSSSSSTASTSTSLTASPKKGAKASSGEIPAADKAPGTPIKKDRSAEALTPRKSGNDDAASTSSPAATDSPGSPGATGEPSSLSAVPAWNSKDFQSPALKKNDTKRFTRANKAGGAASPAMPSTPHATEEGSQ